MEEEFRQAPLGFLKLELPMKSVIFLGSLFFSC